MKSLLPLAGKRVSSGVGYPRWNPGFGSTAEVAHKGWSQAVLLYRAVQILKYGLIKNLPPPALRLEAVRNGSMCVLERTEEPLTVPPSPLSLIPVPAPAAVSSHGGLSGGGFWGHKMALPLTARRKGKEKNGIWTLKPSALI